MEFTGERAVEGKTPERIWRDHIARYEFAAGFVAGKKVLDAACGTGYGAKLLYDSGAESVTGAAISAEAVAFAREKYRGESLRYVEGALANIPFPGGHFDIAVSFETIEHVADRGAAIAEFCRVLKPGGVLLISSPNRLLTSPGKPAGARPDNPNHVFEYDRAGFVSELSAHFRVVSMYGQHPKNKICFVPLLEKFFWHFTPGIYRPQPGGSRLEKMSFWSEYRYMTAVCEKAGGELK